MRWFTHWAWVGTLMMAAFWAAAAQDWAGEEDIWDEIEEMTR